MDWFGADDLWLSRLVLQRALSGIYLIAFVNAITQFRPLLGERGLLPVPDHLRSPAGRQAVSLFRFRYSDRLLALVAWTGAVLAAGTLLGVTEQAPVWASMLVWFLLWGLYLSIVNVGQVFYSFGWESLLLEAGFLAIFLGSADTAPPVVVFVLLRWLLFRVEFGAGLIKLRGDPCWRDLTCLDHHHETQPMPNPLSRRFHHLPPLVHRVEVGANHLTQLAIPFLLFAPQPVASIAALTMVVTQAWLLLSGNFAWLNVLTMTLAVSALDDRVLSTVLPVSAPEDPAGAPTWLTVLTVALAVLVAALSWAPIRNMVSRHQRMNVSFNRLHLVNAYGAFGTVTRERYEVILEGTLDPEPSSSTEWREYEFKGKPGDPFRRPPQVAPYHLRLDWMMWFAALTPGRASPWLHALMRKLLLGDRATLRLLRNDPFPGDPPAVVRARLYRYRFTTPAERRTTRAWWTRSLVGEHVDPLTLRR